MSKIRLEWKDEIWKRVIIKKKKVNYEVSNKGNVRNFTTKKLLKPGRDHKGYLQVGLSINNVLCTKKVHRLVAIAFIPNPDNKPQVNHVNGCKRDNWESNLEWMTNQENQIHAIKTGLKTFEKVRGENGSSNKYKESLIRNACEMIESGKSNQDIIDELGLSYYNIHDLRRNKTWKHVTVEYNF